MQNANIKSHLHLHLIVFIWGFSGILGRLISIDAIPLVWYRMLFASILIYVFIRFKKIALKITRKQILQYAFGGLVIGVHWITFFYAIKISNVSIALAMMSTGAFFTLFIEAIYKKKRIDLTELLFGVLAIIGLYVIYSSEISLKLGMLVALCSSFLSAFFSVFNAVYVKYNNAVVISFYELLFGTVLLSVYLAISGGFLDTQFFTLQPLDYLWIFILSSACTAYAFIVSIDLLKKLSAFVVMLAINLEPIYAIILALILFPKEEIMPTLFYVGALIIVLTVVANGVVSALKKDNKTEI